MRFWAVVVVGFLCGLTLLGCGGDRPTPAQGAPAVHTAPVEGRSRRFAAARVGRSAARYSDAIDGWKVAWLRADARKNFGLEHELRTRAAQAQGWAGTPPATVPPLTVAAAAHRAIASKIYGPRDAALIADLDGDAATNPGNAGRNAMMSGALESSMRLRAAAEDLAGALDALAAAITESE